MDTNQISQIITIFKYILLGAIPFFTLYFVYKVDWNVITKSANEKLRSQVLGLLESDDAIEEKSSYFDLERIDRYLRTHGGYYMFSWLDPFSFLMIKLGAALLGFLVVFSLMPNNLILAFLGGLGGAVVGFFAFDWILNIANDSDNEEMLSDVKSIFDTLRTQTKAGVFLSNSLTECYMIVSNARLKSALLDMTNKIVIKNDIEDAVREFNKEFDSPYIDTLCVTILQSMESGKSVQILEDLSKQISDMQSAINIKEQERLDAKIQLLEMGVFVGLIGSVLYVLVMSMSGQFASW